MLPRAKHTALHREFNAAIADIMTGKQAWADGSFDSGHLIKVLDGQVKIAQRLAEFEDRRYMLHPDTLDAMRWYEQIGADLLASFTALTNEERYDETIRSPSGRYAVARRLILGDKGYEYSVLCINPAAGLLQLDAWEAELRTSLTERLAA